ncbi:MAG: hypothetical protein L0G59_03090 [Kocuria sp.]|nr:hypothetical protein [Kocuria sp.]
MDISLMRRDPIAELMPVIGSQKSESQKGLSGIRRPGGELLDHRVEPG